MTQLNEKLNDNSAAEKKHGVGIFHNFYQRFIKIRGHPKEIALGFSLGIFIGLSPTMGIQIVIAVFIAALLKWNKISAGIGVLITNPLTAPFIYSGTYVLGAEILSLDNPFNYPDEFSVTALMELVESAPAFFAAMTVGGIVVGIPLSVASYYMSYYLVKKYQDDVKSKLAKQKARFVKRKQRKKAGSGKSGKKKIL